ncbi:mRNA cleavage and polyadenylation specificity factor complex associated protein [Schizosaccharomyces cryophilus OY26]|uniref:mRNA cleavage and polyadenylation specificity factor complex associated protein n=1 Tax=Schizosaccharomyces cryophilus (strain OY26 / ATCC MYA-4695 / CBS 11777 / NBRC 106824 / NRRL Y48691) TaxID=653667 RepID=S9XBK7_SCHCR|nr:mRNA cleavage and polyadenylation specificity factor complex associated protein [Schizosaccharomyces cryophilus OY26]EPY51186.1 mRNA cleavage and polyadenylation specificity factor complex associated protein [Schizosaccharomyces cryophilus OY26]
MENYNHTQNGVNGTPFGASFGNQPSNSPGTSQFPVTLNSGGEDLEKNLDEKLMNAFPGLESHVFQHSQPPPHPFEMPASFESHYPSNYFPFEASYPNEPHFPSLASPPVSASSFPTQFPPYSDTDNSWQIPQLPSIASNIPSGQLDPSSFSALQPNAGLNSSPSSSFQIPVLGYPSGHADLKDTITNNTSGSISSFVGNNTPSSTINPSPFSRSPSSDKQVIEKLKSKANQKPTETSLGSLRQTLNECLDPLNTSQAPKECVAILVNMMSTVTQDDQKLLFLEILKNNNEATIFSELVDGGRKLFLPKLRNWFVSAIRSKSDKVIHSILLLLCKLPISAERLADVKFGKPILIVKKKSANSVIRQHAEKLSDLAEKSIAVELGKDQLKDLEKEPTRPETVAKPTNVSSTNSKNPSTKKVTSVPGTSFFKNLSNPKTGPATSAPKPSTVSAKQTSTSTPLSSIVAGLKGKDAELQKSQSLRTESQSNSRDELPSFRKRSAKSEEGSEKSEASSEESSLRKKRRKKSVTWKPDDELVQIKVIEHANEEELAVKTPHIYGSARDLDRQEARVAFGNQVEDDVEDEIIWYRPKPIHFVISKEELHPRGYKRGGGADTKPTLESKDEEEREGQLNVNISSSTSVLSNVSDPLKIFDAAVSPVSIPLPKEVEDSLLHEKSGDSTNVRADDKVLENNSNTHLSSILSNLSSSASSQHLQNSSLMIPDNANTS